MERDDDEGITHADVVVIVNTRANDARRIEMLMLLRNNIDEYDMTMIVWVVESFVVGFRVSRIEITIMKDNGNNTGTSAAL